MESTNNSISFNLIFLIFVLGIISIIINSYALNKKDNEYNARILTPQQTLVKVNEYLGGLKGKSFMRGIINEISNNIDLIIMDSDGDNQNKGSEFKILNPDKSLQFSIAGKFGNRPTGFLQYVTYNPTESDTKGNNIFSLVPTE